MKGLRLCWARCAVAATLAGLSVPALSAGSPTIIALQDLSGVQLKGSKFRHAGLFNTRLAAALTACGKPQAAARISTRGLLSRETAAGVRALRSCPGFELADEGDTGDVTEALWAKLLPEVPIPNAFERMFVVTLTLEGTDYDHFEWNYNAVDPTAWGTWGPYGATVGQGAEVQKILGAVDNGGANPLVRKAFSDAKAVPSAPADLPSASRAASRSDLCRTPASGPADDYELFRKILPLSGPAAGEALRAAYCDDQRFATWIKAFRLLGAAGAIRRAYDRHYFTAANRVAAYIAATRAAYADAGVTATEIDIAMGVDGQTQFSGRANRAKVSAAVLSAGAEATPAQRRAAISEKIPTSPRNRKDRCGRDGVFFVDALATVPAPVVCRGPDWTLKSAWSGRAGFTTATVGLVDRDGSAVAPGWSYDFDRDTAGR